MKAQFSYLPSLLIILLSCNNPGTSRRINNGPESSPLPYHIDLERNIKNIKALNLSRIGKKIEYIPLETTPNSLIGSIFYIANKPAKSNDTVYSWYITDLQCKPERKLINFHKRVNVPGAGIAWTPLY